MKTFSHANGKSSDPNSRPELVDTLCPYCGVGCAVSYAVDRRANRILHARGRNGAANLGRLCVKGRYGFDYSTHPERLTRPLIRRDSAYPKGRLLCEGEGGAPTARNTTGSAHARTLFREATWEEALELVGEKFRRIRDTCGGDALAGLGSAKGSNEEAYLFQKLVRAGFGTNNVDHCTRLCHASSVAALMESMGSGAVTNVVRDVVNADAALLTGCNPTENHPVAATFIKDAAKSGTRLVVVNSRRPAIADFAEVYLPIKPGTDVALHNGLMHILIREGWINEEFVNERTQGFDDLASVVGNYSPEQVARICDVPAGDIERAARVLGESEATMFFWGMGISQHTHGTDNARGLISLALITGNVGRKGTGLHPLRGQNNVQGASDAGLIPMVYPDYQPVDDPRVRERFEAHWGTSLSSRPGKTVTEMTSAARHGEVKGMYVMGENPLLSDPDVNRAREGLAALDFLVVQDIFLTETAAFADVVLPASSFMEKQGSYTNTDRRVQLGRPVLRLPGNARQDWELICEIGARIGYPMEYGGLEEVFKEFATCTQSYAALTYDSVGAGGRWYPCRSPETSEGQTVLFQESFPVGRKARLVPTHFKAADEQPDDQYPYVLSSGRVLGHWHTGTMTRRSKALDEIYAQPFLEINPADAQELGVEDTAVVAVSSRRGRVEVRVRVTETVLRGMVFLPMHYREACANLLTDPRIDPMGKIPGFKFCAVDVRRLA